MNNYNLLRACLLIFMFTFFLIGCEKGDENKEDDENKKDEIIDFSKINFNLSISYDTLIDIDGNIYKTVVIGTQTWMAENLRTTKFNDGIQIPIVIDSQIWSKSDTACMCFYNNDSSKYKSFYGGLYNWYAVSSGKLCPQGWHIPSEQDWQQLCFFLSGATVAGGKIKETDTIHWESPNYNADNTSGFTALASGFRIYDGEFRDTREIARWWSSTVDPAIYAWGFFAGYNFSHIGSYNYDKKCGLSVRCVKD